VPEPGGILVLLGGAAYAARRVHERFNRG
jgi:hypothetical protein